MSAFDTIAHHHLTHLYGPGADEVLQRLRRLVQKYQNAQESQNVQQAAPAWSEKDLWLISYGDSIIDESRPPLEVLEAFIRQRLGQRISGVHLLPFFPWSSDDGFSVIDYREVNPALGDWSHIRALAEHYDVMVDLILNHISRESLWFVDYLSDSLPGRDYFLEFDPETDLSQVVRPRSTPLLVPVVTRRGTRHLWATFSDDQIDLNFANPDVLLEFVDILLFYLAQGARIIRLDAIAFLWKRPGTACVHLPETHTVVRLLRALVDHVAPGTLLVTETNVPHTENISYFGLERTDSSEPDEAHMIYQFTLPPLLLHTLTRGEAGTLREWLKSLPPLPPACTYLNFTASHDGIGVRPLEGLLPDHERDALLELMRRFGGFISMRSHPEGGDIPYEINITWFEAMQGTHRGADPWQVTRFLCSQAIMLSLQGIPALYLHSLTATPNDLEGVERSGRLRSINRRRWQLKELEPLLDSATTPNHEVFTALNRLLEQRRDEPCFHPSAPQRVLPAPDELLAVERGPLPDGRRLLALYNVTDQPFDLNLGGETLTMRLNQSQWRSIDPNAPDWSADTPLPPYAIRWLVSEA
ncbi:sugar phosphorylase [Vreelandella rituensis]|uniref:Alpha-amylase n=1 Tax=Vreelandella rituensis TaxID=2282306 RepID=A0A368U772_9GAMM|nr:sugar phosphorylase [Halomonas rituensis]RCV92287.1 alpha-amylase [Halomonas rituensis]